jgi:hypothetical protein
MRTLKMMALASALLVAATPALAGRDYWLQSQIDRSIAAKRAAQMELAKQQQSGPQQSGVAGPSGQPGKVGPTTTEPRWSGGRAGRPSPADHP